MKIKSEDKLKDEGNVVGIVSGILLFLYVFFTMMPSLDDFLFIRFMSALLGATLVGVFGGMIVGVFYIALCE